MEHPLTYPDSPSSCPLNQWCAPTISSSASLFSFCLQSCPASGSFPVGWLFGAVQWTWIWVNSGRSWGTGKPGVLQSMVSQRITWLSDSTTTILMAQYMFQNMKLSGYDLGVSTHFFSPTAFCSRKMMTLQCTHSWHCWLKVVCLI